MKKLSIDNCVKFVFAFLTIFTVVCFVSNHINNMPQDTLIQWVFTVFGAELGFTMFKKWIDKKYGKDEVNEFDTSFIGTADSGSSPDYLLSDSVD